MKYIIDDVSYDVVIERKKNKNIYIRIKEDMKIHVSCNYLTPNNIIKKVLDDNIISLKKMLKSVNKEIEKKSKFFYLGDSYDIIFNEDKKRVEITNNIIYAKDEVMFNKWLKEETLSIFDEEYVKVFNKFDEDIKSPILKIRNMKTRWGVYNRKNHTITLNSKLIGYTKDKIDYVIIHELSHIIYFNHSKCFWNLVSKYCPEYKKIRKELRD